MLKTGLLQDGRGLGSSLPLKKHSEFYVSDKLTPIVLSFWYVFVTASNLTLTTSLKSLSSLSKETQPIIGDQGF